MDYPVTSNYTIIFLFSYLISYLGINFIYNFLIYLQYGLISIAINHIENSNINFNGNFPILKFDSFLN